MPLPILRPRVTASAVGPSECGRHVRATSEVPEVGDRSSLDLLPGTVRGAAHGMPRAARARDPAYPVPARPPQATAAILHADKGYDYDHLRRWRRKRGIRHRIARRCIESSQRLGRHRRVVERTVSWLAGCRRLHRRYERKAEHFLAFVGIAAALICHRRLTE